MNIKELINDYGRACVRDGNPAWESDEGIALNKAIHAPNRILVEMEGGIIQNISADHPESLKLLVVDFDIEGVHPDHPDLFVAGDDQTDCYISRQYIQRASDFLNEAFSLKETYESFTPVKKAKPNE